MGTKAGAPIQHVKIIFDLPPEAPVEAEGIWAIPVDGGISTYKVDNIPFFAPDIALDDIVFALPQRDQRLHFISIKEHSGNFTTLVILEEDRQEVHEELRNFIKKDALYHMERGDNTLYSISCPIKLLAPLLGYLSEGKNRKLWDYMNLKFPTDKEWAAFDQQRNI